MAIRKVGTCEVKGEIGRGGMGIVYEARQEALDRTVAIKALDAKLARSKELVERFRREGRAYAQLRHQAIVAVHDLVEKEETVYLVTDFVDGADLTRVLAKGGTLPPECAAIVGARVAEALDYVHFNHLLHRDVKPANVMLSRDGEVKLMDFGIAKDERETDLTRAGMLVGSPSYLAPEVLGGDPADAKADVWALGVTLYELLTGEKPFKGRDAEELFRAIRKGSFRRIRSITPACPRGLARAVERCLKRSPRSRWESAGALARALDACAAKILAGMQPQARRRALLRWLVRRPPLKWIVSPIPEMHPQARLVALMTHRGFAKEEEALTRIDAATLLSTRAVDLPDEGEDGATSQSSPPRRRSRGATIALVVAVAATLLGLWLMPLPFRF
ncbi:MAG: protein kinase [Anaeromyxobacteraceae bacterium]